VQLKYSPNSPYVRKVLVLAIELGLDHRMERDNVAQSPYEPDPGVVALNPLGKIPVLAAEDGVALFDSTVACEYLSTVAGDSAWFPPPGPARWRALRTNALANGMLEAAQLVRLEQSRPESVRYEKWIAAQKAKVMRSVTFLENELPSDQDIGGIAVACALGWVDFRLDDLGWRAHAPRLAAWFQAFARRPSFGATRHPGQH
jgi:glutathione S-transferase